MYLTADYTQPKSSEWCAFPTEMELETEKKYELRELLREKREKNDVNFSSVQKMFKPNDKRPCYNQYTDN